MISKHFIIAAVLAATGVGCNAARSRGPTRAASNASPTAAPRATDPRPKPIDVETGEGATCALLDDGAVWCWGKLDRVVNGKVHPPMRMIDVPPARAIAVGSDGCAITRDDEIVCGWLGMRVYTVSGVDAPTAIAVAQDEEHACALTKIGAVACWDPPPTPKREQVTVGADEVAGIPSGMALMLGRNLGCVRGRADRKLHCWTGSGPVPVDPTPVGALALAGEDGCAVVDGEIRCAGRRAIGVSAFGEVAELGLSNAGVCGRSVEGKIFCATRGGRFDPRDDAVAGPHELATVIDLPASTKLSVSPTHACSLSVAGDIDCWGRDDAGEASGRSSTELPPTELPVGDFTELALGGDHAACMLSGNVVACTDSEAPCPTGTFQAVRAQSWQESMDEHWDHVHLLGAGHGVCVVSRRQKAVWDGPDASVPKKGARPSKKPARRQRRVDQSEFLVCLASAYRKETAYRMPTGTIDRAAQWMLGYGVGCIRTQSGAVECFELGERHSSTPQVLADDMRADDATAMRLVPIAPMPPAASIIDVPGHGDLCALTTSGETFCWHGIEAPRRTSVSKASAIAAGRDRICAIEGDGHVGCNELDRPLERIGALDAAKMIAVGDGQGCAVDDRGRVRCWEMHGHFSARLPRTARSATRPRPSSSLAPPPSCSPAARVPARDSKAVACSAGAETAAVGLGSVSRPAERGPYVSSFHFERTRIVIACNTERRWSTSQSTHVTEPEQRAGARDRPASNSTQDCRRRRTRRARAGHVHLGAAVDAVRRRCHGPHRAARVHCGG